MLPVYKNSLKCSSQSVQDQLKLTHLVTCEGPNVSATPITAMGCRQCLPLSVVQLKGKHCQKPHCHNGVVDTFRH